MKRFKKNIYGLTTIGLGVFLIIGSIPTPTPTPTPTPDEIAPVINITGANPLFVTQGETFSDPGAIATDDIDGIVNVISTGKVDITKVGTYIITYTAKDKSDNKATVTRVVEVKKDEGTEKKWNVSNNKEFRKALEDASSNGNNDIIILSKGIYETTSDNLNTFIFNDNENYTLKIKAKKGLDNNDVVISGSNTTQVLNLKNFGGGKFFIEGISIRNGNSSISGGGLYSNQDVEIINSNINNNTSVQEGGGVYTSKSLKIENTKFFANSTISHGGGAYAKSFIIKKSEFFSNMSEFNKGAGFYSELTAKITNSSFRNNESGDLGGGFFCNGETVVEKSKFIENKANRAGGAFSFSGVAIVTNSIFYKNNTSFNGNTYPSGVIISSYAVTSYLYAINNNFIDNSGGVGYKGVLINNIFSGNSYDVLVRGESYLYNNYINNFKITDSANSSIKKNNIQFGSVGNIYLNSDNKTLGKKSPLIDKGINSNSSIFKKAIEDINYGNDVYSKILKVMEEDIDNRERVSNGSIDIGAMEYNF